MTDTLALSRAEYCGADATAHFYRLAPRNAAGAAQPPAPGETPLEEE